jgi:uncharacterized protein
MLIKGIFLSLGLAALLTSTLRAEDEEKAKMSKASTIRVQADATVTASPDQSVIQIAVVTQATKAEDAAKGNAEKADRIIQRLRKVLKTQTGISTINYSLSPDYRYPKEGGQPQIVGYTASNTVEVRTTDLPKVGDLIDAAVGAGANNIQALRFELKDDAAVAARALAEAAKKARAKADAIAAALQLQVVRILSVEEGGPVVIPVQERTFAMARAEAAPPTPVEAGTIEVQASITLTVEVR